MANVPELGGKGVSPVSSEGFLFSCGVRPWHYAFTPWPNGPTFASPGRRPGLRDAQKNTQAPTGRAGLDRSIQCACNLALEYDDANGILFAELDETVMPQSLANVLIHIVFSTKHRQPLLKDRSLRGELHAYVISVLKSLECPSLAVNSVEDHVHILCNLSRKITIAELVEAIKTSTSKWLKTKSPDLRDFYWQSGYGVFSVSQSKRDDVVLYIQRQEEHHRGVDYQDEFRQLCAKHAIEIDERYVWD